MRGHRLTREGDELGGEFPLVLIGTLERVTLEVPTQAFVGLCHFTSKVC